MHLQYITLIIINTWIQKELIADSFSSEEQRQ